MLDMFRNTHERQLGQSWSKLSLKCCYTTKLTELLTCSTYLFLSFPDSMQCFLPGIYIIDVCIVRGKADALTSLCISCSKKDFRSP